MMVLRRWGLPFWAIVIAFVLWVQVHGQGMGSLRMDVALQVRDVPADMVIVNDLPEQVSVTVFGLQSQLNTLEAKDLFVSVDASLLNMPGVIEQTLSTDGINLPVGLKVGKIQPDSVQLQVDYVIERELMVNPVFDLPQGWAVNHVMLVPSRVKLSGPEVWLSILDQMDTTAIRLDLVQGIFDVQTSLVSMSGQSIHLVEENVAIRVRGDLTWNPISSDSSTETLNKEGL